MADSQARAATYESELEAGKLAMQTGLTEEARQHFERAAGLAHDDAQAGEALARLGRAYATLGNYLEAERILREALQRAGNSPVALAQARMQMGTVRWLQGEMKTARAFLEQAQADFKKLGLASERTNALTNLGLVLKNMGEYQRAIDAFQESIQLGEALNDLHGMIADINNLGECYYDLGAMEQAERLFRDGLARAKQLDAEALAIDSLRNLGRLQAEIGFPDEGRAVIEQALDLAVKYQRQYLRMQAMASLAEVWLMQGDVSKARALADELFKLAGNAANYRARATLILGRCSLAEGDGTRALVTLQEGLLDAQKAFTAMLILRLHASLSQVEDHPAIAQVHRRIARELAEQIADSLSDKGLQQAFRNSALAKSIA